MKRRTLNNPPSWFPLAVASVVGLAFVVVFGGNGQGQAAGVAIVVATALYLAAGRMPQSSSGRARMRDGALLLPRRRSYAPLLVVAHAVLALALTTVRTTGEAST